MFDVGLIIVLQVLQFHNSVFFSKDDLYCCLMIIGLTLDDVLEGKKESHKAKSSRGGSYDVVVNLLCQFSTCQNVANVAR